MRSGLSSFLTLHWAIVFALLAFVCMDGDGGVSALLSLLGSPAPYGHELALRDAKLGLALASALLLVAMLFCWAFVELFVDDAERPESAEGVVKIALLGAASVLLVLFVGGASLGLDGIFAGVSTGLAALLTSYVAILAERRTRPSPVSSPAGDDSGRARSMARGAAFHASLARLSGRPPSGEAR